MSSSSLALVVVTNSAPHPTSHGTAHATSSQDQGQAEVPSTSSFSAQPMTTCNILEARIILGIFFQTQRRPLSIFHKKADASCKVLHSTPPLLKTADDHCSPLLNDEELLDYGDGREEESF